MMFSTGLSAISNTRYLQRSNGAQTRSVQQDSHWEPGAKSLPERLREIRLDEIGFDVLADTHNVRHALCLQNWQLDKEKEKSEPQDIVGVLVQSCEEKSLPCFSLQQSRDLRTALAISPENETRMRLGSTNKCILYISNF